MSNQWRDTTSKANEFARTQGFTPYWDRYFCVPNEHTPWGILLHGTLFYVDYADSEALEECHGPFETAKAALACWSVLSGYSLVRVPKLLNLRKG